MDQMDLAIAIEALRKIKIHNDAQDPPHLCKYCGWIADDALKQLGMLNVWETGDPVNER